MKQELFVPQSMSGEPTPDPKESPGYQTFTNRSLIVQMDEGDPMVRMILSLMETSWAEINPVQKKTMIPVVDYIMSPVSPRCSPGGFHLRQQGSSRFPIPLFESHKVQQVGEVGESFMWVPVPFSDPIRVFIRSYGSFDYKMTHTIYSDELSETRQLHLAALDLFT